MSLLIDPGSSGWDERPDELSVADDDWDTVVSHPVITGSLSTPLSTFGKGTPHGTFGNCVVCELSGWRELVCGSGYFGGTVVYKGIADTSRPDRYSVESYGERSSYDNIESPAGGPGPHDVSQPRVGLTHKYVTDAGPRTEDVGTEQTPPLAITPPANVFSSATDVILSYPDGWVLEKSTGQQIQGGDWWLVEDVYVYYQPWRPNG